MDAEKQSNSSEERCNTSESQKENNFKKRKEDKRGGR